MEPKANAVFIKRESEDEEKLNKLKNMLPLTAHEIYDIILGSPGSHKVLPQLANSEGTYLRKEFSFKSHARICPTIHEAGAREGPLAKSDSDNGYSIAFANAVNILEKLKK